MDNKNLDFIISIISMTFLIISLGVYIFIPKTKEMQTSNLEVVIILMIFSILEIIPNLLPLHFLIVDGKITKFCIIESMYNTITGYSISIITALLGYVLMVNLIKPDHIDLYKNIYRIFFFVVVFAIPIIMALIIYFTESYGLSGTWCWINLDPEIKTARKLIVIYYMCFWTLLIINIYFILSVYSLINKYQLKNILVLKDSIEFTKHCNYFTIGQAIRMIPATILKIYNLVNNTNNNHALTLTYIITTHLVYIGYSFVFLTIPPIKKYLLKKIKLLLKCNKRTQSQSTLKSDLSENANIKIIKDDNKDKESEISINLKGNKNNICNILSNLTLQT